VPTSKSARAATTVIGWAGLPSSLAPSAPQSHAASRSPTDPALRAVPAVPELALAPAVATMPVTPASRAVHTTVAAEVPAPDSISRALAPDGDDAIRADRVASFVPLIKPSPEMLAPQAPDVIETAAMAAGSQSSVGQAALVSASSHSGGLVRADPPTPPARDFMTTLLVAVFFGSFGIHRFYTGHTLIGVIQLLTFGGCGVWTIVDIIFIVTGNFADSRGRALLKR